MNTLHINQHAVWCYPSHETIRKTFTDDKQMSICTVVQSQQVASITKFWGRTTKKFGCFSFFQIKYKLALLGPNHKTYAINSKKQQTGDNELVTHKVLQEGLRKQKRQTNRENGRDLKEGYHKGLCAHPATVLQHGGRQHSPRHMGHFIPHFKLEFLHKRIGLVVGTAHLWGKGDGTVECQTLFFLGTFKLKI